MPTEKKAHIIGMGSYLPAKVLTNQALEAMVDTSDEWITSRTGMKERRIAAADEFTSDLAYLAGKQALENAHIAPEKIDIILVATMTPDHLCPSTAALIQHRLGAVNAAAVDLGAACSGYLYGLSLAKAYIESGMYKHVLLVAAEKMSAFLDYTDRTTCVLFGDGASASVISADPQGLSIDSICLGADGEQCKLMEIPAGGSRHPASATTVENKMHTFKMQGQETFKHAVRRMIAASNQCMEKAGYKEQDIRWMLPHQANLRIIDMIAKQMGIADEKVYKTIHKYANTSGSSVAIALDDMMQLQPLKKGEHALLVAFGGGLTWGAAILTRVK